MSELCEMCGKKFKGVAVVWRRGFTAVCCVGCAGELARLKRETHVDFSLENAKWFIQAAIFERPLWDKVTDRIMEDRHKLWEALAKV